MCLVYSRCKLIEQRFGVVCLRVAFHVRLDILFAVVVVVASRVWFRDQGMNSIRPYNCVCVLLLSSSSSSAQRKAR